MKLEAQQEAIAKILGWEQKPWDKDYRGRPMEPQLKWFAPNSDPYWSASDSPPNYPFDLNLMHEAEKVFDTLKKQAGYLEQLTRVCGFDRDIQGLEEVCQFAWALTHSTSAQRAEAFVKTFNKWED